MLFVVESSLGIHQQVLEHSVASGNLAIHQFEVPDRLVLELMVEVGNNLDTGLNIQAGNILAHHNFHVLIHLDIILMVVVDRHIRHCHCHTSVIHQHLRLQAQ